MSSSNRGDRIQLLQKVLKKHYKPITVGEGRSVLDHLLYAALVEDAPFEAAEEVFQRLPDLYVDHNEVRVTTVTELADSLKNLPDPAAAALRLKRTLQSIFEARYSFDLEEMRKMNQGKAIQELEKLAGVSHFMLGYVTQHAFGGHTIPVSQSIMHILLMTGIVTQAEADKNQTPGLERAIPKSKGSEFASCLHQMAAEYKTAPAGKNIKMILKEAGAVELKPVEPKPAPTKQAQPKTAIAAKPIKSEPVKTSGKGVKETPKESTAKVVAKDTGKDAGKDVSKDSGKVTGKAKEHKETKEVKAIKPAKSDNKADSKATKPSDTKKHAVTKKELPPKKPTKSKPAAAPAAKKPVVKKITKRKPK